jgi:indole-3-glycerol phosphate synthase
MTAGILERIVEDKKKALEHSQRHTTLSALLERIARRPAPLDFAAALRGKGVRLIAEVKKASPSRGLLRPDFRPVQLAQAYVNGGAAAISVLTEGKYFLGSLDHLAAIRETIKLPLLRKDFIFDDYQVFESVANGADAILLIVAIMEEGRLAKLLALARALGLACLVEVHDEAELTAALLAGARIIGINNRDLNTFKVDLNVTRRLRLLVPAENIVVSESGIRTRHDMKKMKEMKVDAVLVGEALVSAPDVAAAMKELLA